MEEHDLGFQEDAHAAFALAVHARAGLFRARGSSPRRFTSPAFAGTRVSRAISGGEFNPTAGSLGGISPNWDSNQSQGTNFSPDE